MAEDCKRVEGSASPIHGKLTELFRRGLIFEVEGWRRVFMFSRTFLMSSPYFIGIDIGGTKMAVSIFNVASSSVERVEQFPSGVDCEPSEIVAKMVAVAQQWIGAKGMPPAAVGVSVGAVYDWKSGCVTDAPHLPKWKGFPVVATFKEAFGVPVFAENDANACALAEWRYGAGRGCEHVIFLTFGTGLGAGLILNGRLYRGASGLAGEVGAMRVAESGPAIRGKPGCLEGFASGAGIARLGEEARNRRAQTSLPEFPTAKDVFAEAQAGDAVAIAVVEESTEKLGQGLATLLDVLSPDRIVLGSIFVRAESMIRPLLEKTLQREAMAETNAACQIVPAELGESIGNYGAATLAQLGLAGEL